MRARRAGVIEAAGAALAARSGEGPAIAVVWRVDGAGDGDRWIVTGDDPGRALHAPGGVDAGVDPEATAAIALAAELMASGQAVGTAEPGDGSRLFGELHRATARLLVVGAGHIGLALTRLAVTLGFHVVVLDDREEFASEERFPDASEVRRVDFADPFRDTPPSASDYVVLVTRAHRYDYDCLLHLVDTETLPRYIGMVGSRRRVRAAYGALLESGIPRERLAAIHAPIGVDIGAETPEEIAVSIAAELIAARRGVEAHGSLREIEKVVARWL